MKIMNGKIIAALALWLSLAAGAAAAGPVRKTVAHGGHEREYLVYLPQNGRAARPDGILIALHGFNRTMNSFFDEYAMTPLADRLNCILLAPQALAEQDARVVGLAIILDLLTGTNIRLDAVWGCGLKVDARSPVLGQILNVELNRSVDDVDFIRTAIEQTLAEQSMPAENIFLAGTSMGGYMAYQFATLQPVKLSGVISVAGSMGLNIRGTDGRIATPLCDFHSVTDEVVPYDGSYTESGGTTVALARGKPDVIRYWTETNGAGAPVTERVDYYPSTGAITVDRTVYPHTENEVVHYRISGAGHSYFFRKENGDCMDYVEEIGKFIASHSVQHPGGMETAGARPAISVYPNPARDAVYFGCTTGSVSVYDLTGRLVLSAAFHSGRLDVSSLKRGMYVFHIRSGNSTHTAKVFKL